jgi:adenylate cyclase
MDRKLSAILAADVVGYSALMEHDEAGTFERLRAGRKELFEPEIARHNGHIFKLMATGCSPNSAASLTPWNARSRCSAG